MNVKRKSPDFHKAAGRIVRRLAFVNWLSLLKRSSLFVFGAAVVLLFSLRLTGENWLGPYAALSVIFTWGLLTALWVWFRKPSALDAYALWDEKSRRNEAFLSAYWFESAGTHNQLEKLHIDRSRSRLEEEAAHLKKQVPLSFAHRMWCAPVVFLLLTASPFLKARINEEDKPLTSQDKKRAQKEAARLTEDSSELTPLKGLDKEEKKRAEALKKSLEETARKLRDTGGRTKRDVLEELDQQARKAEELAEELGGRERMDLSAGMLAELERHADTADMASELRKKNAAGSAEETEKLAGRLRSDDLTIETESRIAKAFKKGMEKATKRDRRSLVGRHFQKVDDKLQKKMVRTASDELSELAKKLKRQGRRQKTQKMLQRLARKLRRSGQNLFGRKRRGIKRLASSSLKRLSRLSPRSMSSLNHLPFGRRSPLNRLLGNPPAGKGTPGAPTPGASVARGMNRAPVPGQGQCQGTGSRPGGGRMGGQGTCPGGAQGSIPGQGQGACAGQGQGQGQGAPVPGQGGGQGGLRAGVGSPGMAHSPTKKMKPASTEVVNASPSTKGPSTSRTIEPDPHTEDTTEQAKEIAIDFIKAEEDALSSEPLPISRQEQVLRYFTRLREQIKTTSEENK